MASTTSFQSFNPSFEQKSVPDSSLQALYEVPFSKLDQNLQVPSGMSSFRAALRQAGALSADKLSDYKFHGYPTSVSAVPTVGMPSRTVIVSAPSSSDGSLTPVSQIQQVTPPPEELSRQTVERVKTKEVHTTNKDVDTRHLSAGAPPMAPPMPRMDTMEPMEQMPPQNVGPMGPMGPIGPMGPAMPPIPRDIQWQQPYYVQPTYIQTPLPSNLVKQEEFEKTLDHRLEKNTGRFQGELSKSIAKNKEDIMAAVHGMYTQLEQKMKEKAEQDQQALKQLYAEKFKQIEQQRKEDAVAHEKKLAEIREKNNDVRSRATKNETEIMKLKWRSTEVESRLAKHSKRMDILDSRHSSMVSDADKKIQLRKDQMEAKVLQLQDRLDKLSKEVLAKLSEPRNRVQARVELSPDNVSRLGYTIAEGLNPIAGSLKEHSASTDQLRAAITDAFGKLSLALAKQSRENADLVRAITSHQHRSNEQMMRNVHQQRQTTTTVVRRDADVLAHQKLEDVKAKLRREAETLKHTLSVREQKVKQEEQKMRERLREEEARLAEVRRQRILESQRELNRLPETEVRHEVIPVKSAVPPVLEPVRNVIHSFRQEVRRDAPIAESSPVHYEQTTPIHYSPTQLSPVEESPIPPYTPVSARTPLNPRTPGSAQTTTTSVTREYNSVVSPPKIEVIGSTPTPRRLSEEPESRHRRAVSDTPRLDPDIDAFYRSSGSSSEWETTVSPTLPRRESIKRESLRSSIGKPKREKIVTPVIDTSHWDSPRVEDWHQLTQETIYQDAANEISPASAGTTRSQIINAAPKLDIAREMIGNAAARIAEAERRIANSAGTSLTSSPPERAQPPSLTPKRTIKGAMEDIRREMNTEATTSTTTTTTRATQEKNVIGLTPSEAPASDRSSSPVKTGEIERPQSASTTKSVQFSETDSVVPAPATEMETIQEVHAATEVKPQAAEAESSPTVHTLLQRYDYSDLETLSQEINTVASIDNPETMWVTTRHILTVITDKDSASWNAIRRVAATHIPHFETLLPLQNFTKSLSMVVYEKDDGERYVITVADVEHPTAMLFVKIREALENIKARQLAYSCWGRAFFEYHLEFKLQMIIAHLFAHYKIRTISWPVILYFVLQFCENMDVHRRAVSTAGIPQITRSGYYATD